MAVQRCPKCKLINPGSALTCDCGWSFTREAMGAPLDLPGRARREHDARITTHVAISIGLFLFGVVVLVATDGPSSGGRGYLLGAGAIGTAIGRVIVGLIRSRR